MKNPLELFISLLVGIFLVTSIVFSFIVFPIKIFLFPEQINLIDYAYIMPTIILFFIFFIKLIFDKDND